MSNTNEVLLFSGGLDSYIAWHYLNKPQTVYFDIGLNVCKREIEIIKKLDIPVIIDSSINLANRETSGDTKFIPGRNLYYAMLATKYGNTIYMGGLKDDKVNDKNEEIFKTFSNVLSILNNKPIKILSPFWDMTKADIVKWYLDAGLDPLTLVQTGSCYDLSKGHYCGRCRCCFRKWVALWVNNIRLPFYNKEMLEEYKQRAEDNMYDSQRNTNILQAINKFESQDCRIFYLDIDGILTNETKGHDYENRTPNVLAIDKVNNLVKNGEIVILWTSRFGCDRKITLDWLQKYGVKFSDILFDKPQYDLFIDDKTISSLV